MLKTARTMLAIAIGAASFSAPANAFDIDCKVILCLAGGFPQGCGDAHSYMLKRLRKGKGPFGTCRGGSAERDEYRVPVRMFTRKILPVCLAWQTDRDGRYCTASTPGRREGVIGIVLPQNDPLPAYENEYIWWSRYWDPSNDEK